MKGAAQDNSNSDLQGVIQTSLEFDAVGILISHFYVRSFI